MNLMFRCVCLLALSLMFAQSLFSDSFRCGRKLIRTGDSSGDLLRTCGEPYHKDRGQGQVKVDGIRKKVSVERWYYKKSVRSLEHIVLVYKGTVQEVIVGHR